MSNVQKILDLYKAGKVPESTLIKAAAFKDELQIHLNLTGELKKEAGIFGKAKAAYSGAKTWLKTDTAARNALLTGIAVPTAMAGANILGKGVDQLQDILEGPDKERDFQAILEIRPELKNEDPLLVRKYFDSLHKFAPAIASDPLAGGAYLYQVMKFEGAGGPPYSTIESLVKTQKTYRDTNPLRTQRYGETLVGITPQFKLN